MSDTERSGGKNAAARDLTAAEKKQKQKLRKKLLREQQKERKRLYREYKNARKTVPMQHRPIVCPPDRVTADRKKLIFGSLSRVAVIFFAVFALSYFVCDAFGFTGTENAPLTAGSVFLYSLILTLCFTAPTLFRRFRLPATVVGWAAAAALTVARLLPNPVVKPYEAVLVSFNAARDHMASLGYYAINQNPVPVSMTTGSPEELIATGVYLFILLTAILYAVCLSRRIRPVQFVAAALYSAAILFVVFEYNITRSNWGVTLLIASFAAALVMTSFDAIYIRKAKANSTDTETVLFEEDPPALPAILQRKEEKAAKRTAEKLKKQDRKKKKKAKTPITVEQELNDYFSGTEKAPKKKKEKAPVLSKEEQKRQKLQRKAEKDAAKQKKRAEKAELRAYREYHLRKREAACALGGFAGFGMFALAMLILILPALLADGPYTTIEPVDKKFEYYREYVTALLMGDDPTLDLMTYEGEKANFADISTAPAPLYYDGTELFRVEAAARNPVYLRGWVATDYDDETGSWQTALPDSETLDTYRSLFQTYIDPSEEMMYYFWRALEKGSVPSGQERDYLKTSKSNSSLGFIVEQVNIRRQELKTKTLYMPSFHIRDCMVPGKTESGKSGTFLRGYGTDISSGLSYADYFDGIYSSYRASLQNDGYAAVAMVTTMKNASFYRTLASDIVALNNARAAIAEGLVTSVNSDGIRTCETHLTDGTLLTYRSELRPANGEEPKYSTDKNGNRTLLNSDGYTYIVMPRDVGEAVYRLDAEGTVRYKTVENIPEDMLVDEEGEEIFYPAPPLPFAVTYFECMTDAERGEIASYLRISDYYTNFVYDTYTKKSQSKVIDSFTEEILRQATKKATVDVEETDPETGEVYQFIRSVDVPADYTGADTHNTFEKVIRDKKTGAYEYVLTDAVTDETVYRLRHELVMEIINYLANEENFRYTLYPAANTNPELIGVEQFLAGAREGSCIQYATAAVLVLRELGIPARFVSGYVTPSLTTNYSPDKVSGYTATVRDRNAHAWMEVWFDGVGWVQYECTPAYYDAVYDVESAPYDPTHINPGTDGEEPPEEEDPTAELTEAELAEIERQRKEEERRALIRKIVIISVSVLGAAALIVLFWLFFWVRAKKAQKERDELVARIAAAGRDGSEPPTREEFRKLIDLCMLMLHVCGLDPKPGEFREEYAERLAKTNAGALSAAAKTEKLTEIERSRTVMNRDRVARMLDAVAAEEFGYGAAPEDMVLLARFWRRMYEFEYAKHVNVLTRIRLWLFEAKL